MPIEAVSRELLVRYLDTWVPAALHGARRATFVQLWQGLADVECADASLRVFGEFADRTRGRRLTLLYLADDLSDLTGRLERVQAELHTPVEISVHAVAGDPTATLRPALTAAQSAGAPLFAFADTDTPPDPETLAGKPRELLLSTAPTASEDLTERLRDNGFPLACAVDMVPAEAGEAARRFIFATGQMKHLEAFKNAIWQLDEYAGVRIRDPHDVQGMLLDISLNPSLGPLRRELADHLASVGERSVTEIRQFALTGTVYRAQDVTGALTALLAAGALTREPEHGRLAGDTLIRPA